MMQSKLPVVAFYICARWQ